MATHLWGDGRVWHINIRTGNVHETVGDHSRSDPALTQKVYVDDSTAWVIGEVEQIAEALIGG